MAVTFAAATRTVLTTWREALGRAADSGDAWDAWDAWAAAWAAAGDAARAAARDAADAVGAAAGRAEYLDAISQASAWYEEYERLCGGRAYYRACCWAAGDACRFVEWIHHDGLSAWMCEECWYRRLEEIEGDKPADEREERLWRMEIADGGR